MSERHTEKPSKTGDHQVVRSSSSAHIHQLNISQNLHHHHKHHGHGVSKHSSKKFRTLGNTGHHRIDSFISKHHPEFQVINTHDSGPYRQLGSQLKQPKRNFLIRTTSAPKYPVSVSKKTHSHDHKHEDYIVEGHGTPTPSEKVSRWHRDIFLMSPNGAIDPNSPVNSHAPHPRECICDQCMAEYGTYKLYNQMMQERGMKLLRMSNFEQKSKF